MCLVIEGTILVPFNLKTGQFPEATGNTGLLSLNCLRFVSNVVFSPKGSFCEQWALSYINPFDRLLRFIVILRFEVTSVTSEGQGSSRPPMPYGHGKGLTFKCELPCTPHVVACSDWMLPSGLFSKVVTIETMNIMVQ